MRSHRWLILIALLAILIVTVDVYGATYSLGLRYKPAKDFPLLREKLGSSLALATFIDERTERLYIGYHVSLFGTASYFKSDPFPLERAIQESLLGPLFQNGIKTIPISGWDGKPESLRELEADSILMIQIKQFWMEGIGEFLRTNVKTSVHLVIHLGVKREARVYSRNVEVKRDFSLSRLTPERMERTFNEILTEIFDAFLSNPY